MPLSNLMGGQTVDTAGMWVDPAANSTSGFGADVNAGVNFGGQAAAVNVQITGIIVLLLLVVVIWLAMKWPVP